MSTPVPMPRTYLVTGAASGIGKATVAHLREHGHNVIGADLKDTDISADLATPDGCNQLVDRAHELTDGRLDAVIACAGLAHFVPRTVQVNYFGVVATLEGLRPLLAAGTDPRAVLLSSVASIHPADQPSSTRHSQAMRRQPWQPPRPPSTGVRICDLRRFQAGDRPLAPPYGYLRRLGHRRHPPQRRRPRHDRDPHDRAHARRRRNT